MKTYKIIIRKISQFLASISAIGLFIIIFTIVLDVGGRLLFNRPIYGTLGTIRTLLVFVIFFSIPFAQVKKTHINVEFFINKLKKSTKSLILTFGLLYNFLIITFITYGCFKVAKKSLIAKEKLSGIINYPVWPGRYALALGLLLLSLQYIVDIFDDYKTYKLGEK
ncbi:MAG: hypothetical protein Kow00103_01840 [Candidatus Caldatribacteriota bacterium]